MHKTAVIVAEQLHLDVPRPLDKLFNKNTRAAKSGLTLTLRAFQRHGQFILAVYNAHATPAAAVCRFENHWPAELAGDLGGFRHTRHRLRAACQDRNTSIFR